MIRCSYKVTLVQDYANEVVPVPGAVYRFLGVVYVKPERFLHTLWMLQDINPEELAESAKKLERAMKLSTSEL